MNVFHFFIDLRGSFDGVSKYQKEFDSMTFEDDL